MEPVHAAATVATAMDLTVLKALGAGLATLGMIGAGIGLGMMFGKYFEAVGRQPSAEGALRPMLLMGLAVVEAIALLAFAVAMVIIFVM